MKILKIILLVILFKELVFAQQLIWTHTGGPMGGVVGDMAVNSKGEIFCGIYPPLELDLDYSGLYKSIDNGDSWEKIETQFEDFEVYSIYITDEDHIWVGTNFQDRIYLSTDNGITWQIKRNGYNTGECWAFGRSTDGIMFAGDGQYNRLYRSTNYGDNWELSTNLRPLVFSANSVNVVYAGTHTGLYYTTNNGIDWIPISFFSNIPVSSILADSANNLYCGTGYYGNGNGVYYSSDGGGSWEHLGLEGKVILSLAFDSQGNLYAGSQLDGLFKTTDLGKSWVQYQNGLYRKQVFRLKINKQDDIFIGSEYEGVFRSTNNAESFSQKGLPTSNVKDIVFSGDSLIFSATPSGVQKYNKNTKEWTNLGLQNVQAVDISPSGILYAATFDEGLYKSTNLGIDWILTNLTADTLFSVYNVKILPNEKILVATEIFLRISTDQGLTWEIKPVKTSFFRNGITINNKNEIFVTGFGNSATALYKSTNNGISFDSIYGGFSWIDKNGISSNNNYIILVDIIFGKGIYKSEDNGTNWINSDPYSTSIYSVYIRNDGLVLAGASRKIFYSNDFGNNWSIIPTEDITSEITEDGQKQLYLGTNSSGLYEVDIITSVNDDENNLTKSFNLFQNFPNPFNPSTAVKFETNQLSTITIKVFNVLGKEITTLLDKQLPPGSYVIDWEAKDDNDKLLPSGVYLIRFSVNNQAGNYTQTKKAVLLK